MIIIINGSLGVGKSSVAEQLHSKFDRSVHLDGDYIGDVHPFEIYDPARIDHLYRTLELLVGFHQKNGYPNFVINYVFESSDSLQELFDRLQPLDPAIHTYWLTCEEQEQARRIRDRQRDSLEWELSRFRELQSIQAEAAKKGFIGKELDTTRLTSAEAAERIREDIFRSGAGSQPGISLNSSHRNDPIFHSSTLPTIQADRIELRWLTDADVPSLYSIFSNDEAVRYWSSPPYQNMEQAKALLDGIQDAFRNRRLFQWGVSLKAEGTVIGTCTLLHLDLQNRRAEVGYILAREYWGQGLMTEALSALLHYAFTSLGLHRIEADVDPRNTASLRLLERLGFQREGLLRERWLVGNEIQDSVLLGLLRHEWAAR